MLKLFNREDGNVLVMVAASMFALMGLSALGIDVGYILTARNQLQAAVDASALAGGSGLIVNKQEATDRAIAFAAMNNCINEPVVIKSNDVTFPEKDRIRVRATRPLDLFFGRALGIPSMMITAVAEAEMSDLNGTGNLKPWAVPDSTYPLGQTVILKAGELGADGSSSGWFYPVDFPPLNKGTPITGGDTYETNIIDGSADPVEIGDILQVEPGNMVGPTAHGIQTLIDMDPNAWWNESTNMITDSDYPGFDSPRIIKIPFFDPDYPPDSGRNTVEVVRLGAFFLEGVQGRNVYGRFIEITEAGNDFGLVPTMIKALRLVE